MKTIALSPAVKAALEGSIDKWESIVAAFDARTTAGMKVQINERGGDDCPLCQLFNANFAPIPRAETCAGCPIAITTGETFCNDTPYDKWSGGIDCDEERRSQEVAQEFLDFLTGIRDNATEQKD